MNVKRGGLPITLILLITCASCAAACASTAAQNDVAYPSPEPAQMVQIEILGSHIRNIDLENQQPIVVLDRAYLERTGLTRISDVVQSIVANGQAANRNINNGSHGEQLIDMGRDDPIYSVQRANSAVPILPCHPERTARLTIHTPGCCRIPNSIRSLLAPASRTGRHIAGRLLQRRSK